MEDRGDKTSLSGLLMKLEGRHRNSLSSRWSWKWVTCSPTEISYYNKPAAPTAGQKPKKTFPIRDCVVRFDKDKRVIVVVGTLSRGSASSGDDGPYTAAFKLPGAFRSVQLHYGRNYGNFGPAPLRYRNFGFGFGGRPDGRYKTNDDVVTVKSVS